MFHTVLLNNQLISFMSLSSRAFSKEEKFVGLQERGNGKVTSGPAMDLLLLNQESKRHFHLFCLIFGYYSTTLKYEFHALSWATSCRVFCWNQETHIQSPFSNTY